MFAIVEHGRSDCRASFSPVCTARSPKSCVQVGLRRGPFSLVESCVLPAYVDDRVADRGVLNSPVCMHEAQMMPLGRP
jgi:hypothetical protein